jgi:hypothetical protein
MDYGPKIHNGEVRYAIEVKWVTGSVLVTLAVGVAHVGSRLLFDDDHKSTTGCRG